MKNHGHSTFAATICLAFLVCANVNALERPNLVWIVSEDNSASYLRLYDRFGADMPQVEQLARNGLVFNNAYSNAPVCSVARSSLISGCYAPRIGAQFHRRMTFAPMPEGLRMFPSYLREAGYYCTNNSKEDYNLVKSEDVWDESSKNASYRDRRPGQPFFHVQNFATTHEGNLHFDEEMMAKTRADLMENVQARGVPYMPETELVIFTREYYLERHRELDREIGAFLQQLEADGLLEDTIIFYYGDHGGVLPRSKGYLYETGLNIPLVVTVPERWAHLFPARPGERIDGFVEFVDFGPTVLNLAGLRIPDGMDGTPFLGANIELAELNRRDEAFGYADRFDEKYDMVRSLRIGRYKYIRNFMPFNADGLHNEYRYFQMAYREWRKMFYQGDLDRMRAQFFRPKSAEALYDLATDPYERRNLAENADYAGKLVEMRTAMAKKLTGMPDLSLYPESYLLEHAMENPTGFGRAHRDEISQLLDVANLQLQSFGEAEASLRDLLEGKNPWIRYWAAVACCAFGQKAAPLKNALRAMAERDDEVLVRMRASQFLAMTGDEAGIGLILDCLESSRSEAEGLLVLNAIAMLAESPHAYAFPSIATHVPQSLLGDGKNELWRRVRYLDSLER